MKKVLFMLLSAVLLISSCEKTKITTAQVVIALQSEGSAFTQDGINVVVKETASGTTFEALTDDKGEVSFELTDGIYTASATWKTSSEGVQTIYNGLNTDVVVTAGNDKKYVLELQKSEASQVIIKELYTAGCTSNSKAFTNDAYVILYNNTDQEADASEICFGICDPANSNATNKYLVDGKLTFEEQGWLPAGYAVWWFQSPVKLAPYSQIVVAIKGGTDNTVTYPESVDLSTADYYMYDPESGFKLAAAYPAPPASMPVDHYLKTYLYGMGTAWPISNTSPAFFIFKKADAEAFAKNEANYDKTVNVKLPVLKVPMECVTDAIDVYNSTTMEKNAKRLPASIDAGYVAIQGKKGYTAYRNVDKEATEALAENEGKLVYNYAGGTEDVEGSTDPSGIDAEASIANGAHIIYKDTNNSSNDFHQRKVASIKKTK